MLLLYEDLKGKESKLSVGEGTKGSKVDISYAHPDLHREEAERNRAMQEEFIDSICHECECLRQPLCTTTLISYLASSAQPYAGYCGTCKLYGYSGLSD